MKMKSFKADRSRPNKRRREKSLSQMQLLAAFPRTFASAFYKRGQKDLIIKIKIHI